VVKRHVEAIGFNSVIASANFPHIHGTERSTNVAPLKPQTPNEVITDGSKLEILAVPHAWTRQYADSPIESHDNDGELPGYFNIFIERFPGFVESQSKIGASELPIPKDDADEDLKMITEFEKKPQEFQFPAEDEHVKKDLTIKLLPLLDNWLSADNSKNTQFKGNRLAAIHHVREVVGNLLDEHVFDEGLVVWENVLTDEAMKRIMFSSLGQHLVKRCKDGEGFVVDLLHMLVYKARKGYESFACRATFNKDGDIIKVEEPNGKTFTPAKSHDSKNDQRWWEWIKQKVRTATFISTQLLHLSVEHYTWGNYGCTALRKFLPKNHAFRIAFSVHFWRTAFTCSVSAPLLYSKRGLLSRVGNVEYEGGLEQMIMDNLGNFKFGTYTEDLKKRGVDNCAFHVGTTDGRVDLHKIIVDYVADMIDFIYPNDKDLENDEHMKKAYGFLFKNLKCNLYQSKDLELYNKSNMKLVSFMIICCYYLSPKLFSHCCTRPCLL